MHAECTFAENPSRARSSCGARTRAQKFLVDLIFPQRNKPWFSKLSCYRFYDNKQYFSRPARMTVQETSKDQKNDRFDIIKVADNFSESLIEQGDVRLDLFVTAYEELNK